MIQLTLLHDFRNELQVLLGYIELGLKDRAITSVRKLDATISVWVTHRRAAMLTARLFELTTRWNDHCLDCTPCCLMDIGKQNEPCSFGKTVLQEMKTALDGGLMNSTIKSV